MKKYEYDITGDLFDKKGNKIPFAESVFLYNSGAISTARKRISDKYRGQGYNVKIHLTLEVPPQNEKS